ncbi:hypothetical protein [Devriesea agamarum]|uniref:hypothetical protein n=1 Tax=Devriesea agamarum TaxID=472569 RepID=UPI00071D501B|nr:hypothetical protein [Devriesea agamarum]
MAVEPDRLACVVASDGFICRGFMIESCENIDTGVYEITWKVPLQGGDVKTNFSCIVGAAGMESVDPGFCTVKLTESPRVMQVNTYDPQGNPAPRPFHLVAFRD